MSLLLLSDRMLFKIEQIRSVGVGVPSAGPVAWQGRSPVVSGPRAEPSEGRQLFD